MALVVAILAPSFVFSETLVMTDGSRIQGDILSQTRDRVTIRLSSGETRVVPKSSIRRVMYSDHGAEANAAAQQRERERAAELRRQQLIAAAGHFPDFQIAPEPRIPPEIAAAESAPPNPEDVTGHSDVSYLGAGARSAALPGWGQYATGRQGAAYGFAGATWAGLGLMAYLAPRLAVAGESDFASGVFVVRAGQILGDQAVVSAGLSIVQSGFNRGTELERSYNIAAGFTVAMYLWNIFDAAYNAPSTTTLNSRSRSASGHFEMFALESLPSKDSHESHDSSYGVKYVLQF